MNRAVYVRDLDLEYGPLFRGFVQALRRCEVPRTIKLDFEQDSSKRRYLLKRLVEDAEDQLLKCHEEFISRLVSAGDGLGYKQRVAWGSALNRVFKVAQSEAQREILKVLLESPYRPVRRQGYDLCRNPDTKQGFRLLREAWNREPDPELADVLAFEAPLDFLEEHFSELRDAVERDAALTQLYLRSAEFDPDLVHSFARENPIGYMYVMAKLGRKVHEEFCWYVLVTYSTSVDVGLVLWALGRQGHWKILRELHENPPGSVWTGSW